MNKHTRKLLRPQDNQVFQCIDAAPQFNGRSKHQASSFVTLVHSAQMVTYKTTVFVSMETLSCSQKVTQILSLCDMLNWQITPSFPTLLSTTIWIEGRPPKPLPTLELKKMFTLLITGVRYKIHKVHCKIEQTSSSKILATSFFVRFQRCIMFS